LFVNLLPGRSGAEAIRVDWRRNLIDMRDAREVAIKIASRNIGLLREQVVNAGEEVRKAGVQIKELETLIKEKIALIDGLNASIREQEKELSDFIEGRE